jgi:DNA anti-recombination protein RmuC
MNFEQMQSTMQFIVEQQAQHAVLMHKYEERVGRLEDASVTLTKLARNVDERMDSVDERLDSLDEHLKTQIESLHAYLQAQSEDFYARLAATKADFYDRLAANKADFDARLATSREEFDRHLNESTERGRAIDQRLSKLSDLLERDVRRRNEEL